ncbi:MAG: hypothetical protein U0289_06180 [Cyclobacteriaceae bacterium]|nr:hypothetical protein [Cytophagales bacterium]HNP77534.1 hypothetical protein [Cyclobacteriaceae bacterium]
MTNPTRNKSEFISVLREFLSHGLLDKGEVVRWADKEIAAADQPDDYLIGLSLTGTKTTNEVIDLLGSFMEETRSLSTGRAIIGLTWGLIKTKAVDYKKGMEVIYAANLQFPLGDIESKFIYQADSGLDLAVQNIWGEQGELEKEIAGFLGCYEGFSFDNADDWDRLAMEVDNKLDTWIHAGGRTTPKDV